MHFRHAQLIRAPREKVFAAFTDYESYPKWDPVVFTRVKVTERTEHTARFDAEVRFLGLRMPRTESHVLNPPDKVEVTGGIRGGTNTTIWTFESVAQGTLLTADLEARLEGALRLLEPLAQRQLGTALPEWMSALARYVESN
jgi:uncharacterized protein YndB with AHSA1/START domain